MHVLQMGNPNQLLFSDSRRGEHLVLVYECGPGAAEQNPPPKLCLFVEGSSRLHYVLLLFVLLIFQHLDCFSKCAFIQEEVKGVRTVLIKLPKIIFCLRLSSALGTFSCKTICG